ncbi:MULTISPECIES: hypothetical protein [unclassified Streptomyces]|uniref:hypothetical protein n=1 Tax=unclassified Streptomyces TaxID=2593676 RepID=UPI00093A26E6|nr:hypothetical protein [Streptomyces sp. TSRI0281]OKI48317.1 hypothetical protein A6A29_04645 [Streptomyces sp. TSRI0281]
MDPISLGVLAALAGGAGGEIGRQAWSGLTGLVRRRRDPAPGTPDGAAPEPDTAETALTALEGQPGDHECAGELERALRTRVEADQAFARAVRVWEAMFQASLTADPDAAADLEAAVRAIDPEAAVPGSVHNDFRDSTFSGPVQGSGTQNNTFNG